MVGKVLLEVARALFWISAAAFVTGIFGWINVERPPKERGDGKIELRQNWLGIAVLAMVAMALPGIVHTLSHWGSKQLPFFASATISLILGGLIFSDLPGSIIVSADGLEEQFWLRKNKRIRWSEIAEIESERKRGLMHGSITIRSSNGTKIVHNTFDSGRSRLLQELKLHCGDELPSDFPREPLENA